MQRRFASGGHRQRDRESAAVPCGAGREGERGEVGLGDRLADHESESEARGLGACERTSDLGERFGREKRARVGDGEAYGGAFICRVERDEEAVGTASGGLRGLGRREYRLLGVLYEIDDEDPKLHGVARDDEGGGCPWRRAP